MEGILQFVGGGQMLRRLAIGLLALLAGACGGIDATTTAGETERPTSAWTADAPPSEWASGLTIDHIPPGFTLGWNEGHETATFHVFTSEGDSTEFAVGRQISPAPYPTAGREVIQDGRIFTVAEDGETRILEDAGNGIRIEVVSRSLGAEVLLRIAEGVHYDPGRDASVTIPPVPSMSIEVLLGALQVDGIAAGRLDPGIDLIDWFGVRSQRLCVDGQIVWAWEYRTEAGRLSDSNSIAVDASHIGPGYVEVNGRFRFFGKGELLLLYLGMDGQLTDALAAVMGESLTPDAPPRGPFGGEVDRAQLVRELACEVPS